jgi:hypothetical protein
VIRSTHSPSSLFFCCFFSILTGQIPQCNNFFLSISFRLNCMDPVAKAGGCGGYGESGSGRHRRRKRFSKIGDKISGESGGSGDSGSKCGENGECGCEEEKAGVNFWLVGGR